MRRVQWQHSGECKCTHPNIAVYDKLPPIFYSASDTSYPMKMSEQRKAICSACGSLGYNIMGNNAVITRQRKGLIHEMEKLLYFLLQEFSMPNTKQSSLKDKFAQRHAHWHELLSLNDEHQYIYIVKK